MSEIDTSTGTIPEDIFTDAPPEPKGSPDFATVVTVDEDGVQLVFDGEEEATEKRYRYLVSCAGMQPNDRVLLAHSAGTSVVVGILAPPVPPAHVEYAQKAGYADEAGHALEADHATASDTAKKATSADSATNANYASTAFQATQAETARHSYDTDAVIDSTVSGRYMRFYASGNTLYITHSAYGTFRVVKT